MTDVSIGRVLGVDGCRGGWLAAYAEDDGSVRWQHVTTFRAVHEAEADVIGVDVPIGLPDMGVRACDVEARRLLGRRASSVFAAPARAVLDCASYADARALLTSRGLGSMSAQAFGIVRAVRDVDGCLSSADEGRIVEVHPEVAFTLLNGGEPLPGKRLADGHRQRLDLLRRTWPDVEAVAAAAPAPAQPDDVLDALVCAVVARRWRDGAAMVLGDGQRDARNILMRIVA
jgi:predicted RNase H-like nuclease